MHIDLDGVYGALDDGADLPRANWDVIAEAIAQRCGADERFEAWTDAALQWLHRMAARLRAGALQTPGADRYVVHSSKHFVALHPLAEHEIRNALQFAERARAAMLKLLGGVARAGAQGKHVWIVLQDYPTMARYAQWYQPRGAEEIETSGVCLGGAFPHIVQLATLEPLDLRVTLAHELNHLLTVHLDLPTWVSEGLAQHFELLIVRKPWYRMMAALRRRHFAHWRQRGLDEFWSGSAWAYNEGRHEAYVLARLLIKQMYRADPGAFRLFLKEARRADAGQRAAREHLGMPLEAWAAQLLGPGNWTVEL